MCGFVHEKFLFYHRMYSSYASVLSLRVAHGRDLTISLCFNLKRANENQDFPLTCCKKARENGGALQIRPFYSKTTYPAGCPVKVQDATASNPEAIVSLQ